jgi:hypothetical protein
MIRQSVALRRAAQLGEAAVELEVADQQTKPTVTTSAVRLNLTNTTLRPDWTESSKGGKIFFYSTKCLLGVTAGDAARSRVYGS